MLGRREHLRAIQMLVATPMRRACGRGGGMEGVSEGGRGKAVKERERERGRECIQCT